MGDATRASLGDGAREDYLGYVSVPVSFQLAFSRSAQDGSGEVRRVVQIGTRKSQVSR